MADEIVAFGDGRLALAFKSEQVSFCWSHLIDMASFDILTVDDTERLPAAVLTVGANWTLGFDSVSACSKAASFAPGNLWIDDRGTWLVAGYSDRDGGLSRFGLIGTCRGCTEEFSEADLVRTFRVSAWRAMMPTSQFSTEPFNLELGEGKKNAGWFRRSSTRRAA